ncbi:MAG TPA: epoxide hydrolase [Puia sp.]|jgi:pimeloyl-ACP methyl ester carboxylesterase|nr:epoxide hydrolase [Puia sp.]
MSVQPYSISISPFVIEDLRERLGRARWPDEISGSGWEYGTNMAFLKDLCTHWGHGFDWKEEEEHLNTFAHFQTRIDETNLHFIHEKGKGADPVPLLLIHGYPDSFARFLKLIPLLTAEGPDGLSFDVIVPSIPGFGFSDRPSQPGMNSQRIAGMFARLMTQLGYEKFISHGGDWGSVISEELAFQFPDRLLGLHLTEVPYYHLFTVRPDDLSSKEKEYLQAGQQWQRKEGAYALLQSTKPQTLAYAVNDSPIGLAAWIIEKFYSWSDCGGDLEKLYARDELLTNLTIYWVTQTAGSAFRIYYEQSQRPRQGSEKIKVPAAFCVSAKDLVPAPREFAERFFNVQQWTQLPSGGHFAAMEQPGRLAEDLFRFAGKVVARPVEDLR